jgi:hypothetical protein
MKPAAWFEQPIRRESWRPQARIRHNQRTAGSELALCNASPGVAPTWSGRAALPLRTLDPPDFADATMMGVADITIPPMAQKTESV